MRPENPRDPATGAGLSPAGEGRLARSWRLTRAAWSIVRGDRAILALAAVQLISTLVGTALLFGLAGWFSGDARSGRLAMVSLALAYPLTCVGTFVGVAICAAADASMRGRPITTRAALGVARGRLGPIALWSLGAAGVGVLLERLASLLPAADRVVAWLLGMAWSVATLLVVPVLALEDRTAPDTVRRSARLVRSSWGEGLGGSLAIGGWTVLVALPAGALMGAGVSTIEAVPALGMACLAAAIVTLLLVATAGSVTRSAFSVALLHHAAAGGGAAPGPFLAADLARPFTPPRRERLRHADPAGAAERWKSLGLALAIAVGAFGWLAVMAYRDGPEAPDRPLTGIEDGLNLVLALPGIVLLLGAMLAALGHAVPGRAGALRWRRRLLTAAGALFALWLASALVL